jgi:hypothetical protein
MTTQPNPPLSKYAPQPEEWETLLEEIRGLRDVTLRQIDFLMLLEGPKEVHLGVARHYIETGFQKLEEAMPKPDTNLER